MKLLKGMKAGASLKLQGKIAASGKSWIRW